MSPISDALEVAYAYIWDKYGYRPFTQEFLFGEGAAKARNNRIMGPDGGRPLLSWVLREPMPEGVRKSLFPGSFDLGNCLAVPADKCSYDGLATEIMRETGRDAGETIRTIRRGIVSITERKLTDYDDRSTVLKVIKTFFKVMRDRGQDRIFGLIRAPSSPDEAHFEFRDAFPLSKNEKNTWIVADLKAYLGAEIPKQKLNRIDRLFGAFVGCVERTREKTEWCAYSKKEYARVVKVCETLRKQIEAFQIRQAKSQASLDEDLYVHLCRAEFLHFAGELRVAFDAARPAEPIAAVVPDLRRLCRSVGQRVGQPLKPHTEFLVLATFIEFAKEFASDCMGMVINATGLQIDDSTYHKCIPYAEELLFRVNFMGRGTLPSRNAIWVSVRSIAAALCAVLQEHSLRSEIRPRWFGHKYQGGSLFNALSGKVYDSDGQTAAEERPEVFLQIWAQRLLWVQEALCNHLELAESKLALRKSLLTKLTDCVKAGPVDTIEEALDAFDQHVSSACAQLSE